MESKQWNRPWNKPWNNSWNRRKSEYSRIKPDGGYCFISAMALIRAWWAYKRRIIRLYDLRVWFACFELVARRCNVAPNRFPSYSFEEVHRLVGGSDPANVHTAVRRLSHAGLVNWSERQIRFATIDQDFALDGDDELQRMLDLVVNRRRKVPVPRRTLRFLAGLTRPVGMATMIGHLLRCLYFRQGMCAPDGRCKASWIAETFSVDVRNVKAARQHLCKIGWLVFEPSTQTALNRWGAAVRINLAWKHERESGNGSPPPASKKRPQTPPPRNNRKLSSRMIHQKPAQAVSTGAYREEETDARLTDVKMADLTDTRRLESLFLQALRRGWTHGGEAARLRFFAAAERAKFHGRKNPCGLFVWLIRQQRWDHLTLQDEDRARTTLRRVVGGQTRSRRSRTAHAPPISADCFAASRSVAPVAAGTVLMNALAAKHPTMEGLSSLLQAFGTSESPMTGQVVSRSNAL
ncbi:hypothetical protein RAS1_07620 [Phycisphaerae bacterium RAS1]|nr:hypothetical protein RAS1_07620 [Phycisphaerae bacterium RAS1]